MSASRSGDESTADREVVITRVFDAPARLLFEAYSKPEHVKKWFGPKGWPVTLCEMDFRKGGRFRFAMTGPDGRQGPPFGGEYLEIIPNRKIVYDNAFEMPGAEKMIVTITFDEKDEQTTLTIHTLFASVAMKNEHVGRGYVRGISSGLDQLADVVAELGANTAFEQALATAKTAAPARAARRDLARKIVVSEFVSLDGVMEAPGGEPGHPHTGWVRDFMSAEQIEYKLAETLEAESLLIGRVTYETFAASWPKRSGELADKMNAMPKHVISTTLRDPEWSNCRVINGNVAEEVTRLKKQAGGPILVVGSRRVVHTLMEHDLVDEYRVMIFPVALGGGRRLFPETPHKTVLRLVDTRTFSSGVVVHAYHPASA